MRNSFWETEKGVNEVGGIASRRGLRRPAPPFREAEGGAIPHSRTPNIYTFAPHTEPVANPREVDGKRREGRAELRRGHRPPFCGIERGGAKFLPSLLGEREKGGDEIPKLTFLWNREGSE